MKSTVRGMEIEFSISFFLFALGKTVSPVHSRKMMMTDRKKKVEGGVRGGGACECISAYHIFCDSFLFVD